jgi:hypothetical protein
MSSIIYGVIAGLITWFFMYLDEKLLDNHKTKSTYWKNIIFVALLVGLGIRVLGEEKFDQAFGFANFTGGGQGSYLDGLGEEIMTGTPNF